MSDSIIGGNGSNNTNSTSDSICTSTNKQYEIAQVSLSNIGKLRLAQVI